MTHDNDRNTTELQDMPQSSRLQPLSTRTSPSPNSASTPRTSVSNNHDQTSSQNKTPQDSENIVKVNNDSQTEDGILQNKRQSSYFVQQEGDDLSNGDIVPGDGKALVNRALRPIHIFMITVSATLGIGLYVRSGLVLRLAGPLAVLVVFTIDGFLAWSVMQCIAEMVCLWPIPGALIQYPKVFVDPELGDVVGVTYWFTYAISFPALIAATAEEAQLWDPGKGTQGGVIFLVVPAILVIFNAFGVERYGLFEVIGGTAKISFLATAIVVMGAINAGAGPNDPIGRSNYRSDIMIHDKEATSSWAQAFLASLSIIAFAFVGVEVFAACALEARPSTQTGSQNVDRTIKLSAVYLPFLVAAVYVLAGGLVTLNVSAEDLNLPQVSWATGNGTHTSTDSAFVLAMQESKIPRLDDVINVFLLFTAISCANTNLYVASRTLFGLMKGLESGPGERWYVNLLAKLGETNDRRVPMKAMLASCVFLWTPFLLFIEPSGPGTKIIDVLSEMGSVGVVMVWSCECWAFIRFHRCLEKHESALEPIALLRRRRRATADIYPYRSHGQPFVAYIGLAGSVFILVVANSASLWNDFHVHAFLSAYLAPICFLVLFVSLKIYRRSPFQLEDLNDEENVLRKFEYLIRQRDQTFDSASTSQNPEPGGNEVG